MDMDIFKMRNEIMDGEFGKKIRDAKSIIDEIGQNQGKQASILTFGLDITCFLESQGLNEP